MNSAAPRSAPPSPILPVGVHGPRPGRVLLPCTPSGGRVSPSLRSPMATPPRAEASASAFTAVEEEEGFEESLYDLLGVPSSGSAGEIKKAYKQLARKYHPDASPPERAEEYTRRFIEVQEAYETLSDPRRRAVYDRYMCRGFSGIRRVADEESRVASNWRARWNDQIEELEKMSMNDDDENLTWGARMRRRAAMEMNLYQN